MKLRLIHPDFWFLAVGSLLIFGLTYFALVEIKNGDFTHSLLVSQALIEHQTVQLDAYKDKMDLAHHFDYNYRLEKVNGHYYYLFPLAPSVLAVPVVGIARLLGQDMAVPEQEYTLLKILSAVSCGLIFIIIYGLCRCYLDWLASGVITLVSMLGSTLMSALGTPLSSMNVAVLFIVLSLLLIAAYDTGRLKNINPILLGGLLFLAFWSRPTTAPFIAIVFIYVFWRHRVIFGRLVLAALAPLLLFMGWCWLTYGQLLPYFYSPGRLVGTPTFWVAFYGNSFSPARGLFVFSPFLLLVVGGAVGLFHNLKRYHLFWLSLVWFGLFYIAVSRKNEDWWDGHNFGPHALTDGLPALIMVTIFLWRAITQSRRWIKVAAAGSYLVLGMVGILINTYQGLYNPSTYRWNKNPNIDRYPEYLFDWKYPQFLATETVLRNRILEHQQKRLNAYSVGDAITFNSDKAVFGDWYEPDLAWRWSQGVTPRLVFKLGRDTIDPGQQYALEILGGSLQTQTIGIGLNDTRLGDLTLTAFTGAMPAPQILPFRGTLLQEDNLNVVNFYLSQADPPAPVEARKTGLAFVSLKIYPLTGDSTGVQYFNGEFFQSGFSQAEKSWRWTDGLIAEMGYPSLAVEPNKEYILEIIAGALGQQPVEIILNGTKVGLLTFEGITPSTQRLTFPGTLLKADQQSKIGFLIPNAVIPAGDSRRLGLAFVSLKIYSLDR